MKTRATISYIEQVGKDKYARTLKVEGVKDIKTKSSELNSKKNVTRVLITYTR